MKILRTYNERVMRAGYVIKKERVTISSESEGIDITSAYTPSGYYIGTPSHAYRLCVKRGIVPEPISDCDNICSIGFSHKDGKWYGWSHRAIFGFKKGSTCKKGDCHYLPDKGEWTATSIADARQMAIDFSNGVS